MGFNYYRKVADTQEYLDEKTVDNIIKYNVLPTLASGALLFCVTMFLVNFSPILSSLIYSIGGMIFSIIFYLGMTIAAYIVSYKKSNNVGLFLFYGSCLASGLLQAPVIQFAIMLIGFQDTLVLFSIAVLSATMALLATWFLVRYTDKFFKPGEGFKGFGMWIFTLFAMGMMIWVTFSLFYSFTLYLLLSSLVSIFIVGIYTYYDIRAIRSRVSTGRWVYATIHLAIDYFILIVRIFLLLVIGRASSSRR